MEKILNQAENFFRSFPQLFSPHSTAPVDKLITNYELQIINSNVSKADTAIYNFEFVINNLSKAGVDIGGNIPDVVLQAGVADLDGAQSGEDDGAGEIAEGELSVGGAQQHRTALFEVGHVLAAEVAVGQHAVAQLIHAAVVVVVLGVVARAVLININVSANGCECR